MNTGVKWLPTHLGLGGVESQRKVPWCGRSGVWDEPGRKVSVYFGFAFRACVWKLALAMPFEIQQIIRGSAIRDPSLTPSFPSGFCESLVQSFDLSQHPFLLSVK